MGENSENSGAWPSAYLTFSPRRERLLPELGAVAASCLGRNGEIELLNRSQREPSRRVGGGALARVAVSGFLTGTERDLRTDLLVQPQVAARSLPFAVPMVASRQNARTRRIKMGVRDLAVIRAHSARAARSSPRGSRKAQFFPGHADSQPAPCRNTDLSFSEWFESSIFFATTGDFARETGKWLCESSFGGQERLARLYQTSGSASVSPPDRSIPSARPASAPEATPLRIGHKPVEFEEFAAFYDRAKRTV